VVRGMRIRRAVDAEARHRGAEQSRVPRDQAGVSVLDRSGVHRLDVWTRLTRRSPASARIRSRSWSTRPRHLLRATSALPGKAAPPARLGPGEAPVPRATNANWAGRCRTSRWCSSLSCRRRVRRNGYPSPDVWWHLALTLWAARPGVPCPHAHGLAWPHRDRLLTTLTSASKVRGE
jgi:hypothetical protein